MGIQIFLSGVDTISAAVGRWAKGAIGRMIKGREKNVQGRVD